MKNLISIIVPVYNAESFIVQTIASLRNQSYENIEILLIDDGSTDNSLDICYKFEKKDPRIQVFHKKNEGVSATRNFGINKSSGKYLMFVDSDDFIDTNTIKLFLNLKEKYNADLTVFGMRRVNDNLETTYTFQHKFQYFQDQQKIVTEAIPNLLMTEALSPVCTNVYSSEIIKNNNIYFNEKLELGEDLLFNYNYIRKISSIIISNEITYNYRIHSQQTLTTKLHPHKYEMLMYVNTSIRKMAMEDKQYHIISDELNKIRIKNIYSVIKDYIKIKNKQLTDKNHIKSIIKSENDKINKVNNGFIYKILEKILKTNNYPLIIVTAKLIVLIRERQGIH